MPLFSESTISAVKCRFRFHQSKQSEPGEESSVTLKRSSSTVNLSSKFEDEDSETVSHAGGRVFEFREDPSFWKEHNVQVIIRVRPLSSSEISVQGKNICVKQDSSQSITWLGQPESRFTFDIVADENVSQESLFKVAGVPMVENCMEGYNSCMFAYGQTGSGKTHTMLGDIEEGTRRHSVNCGMTPRVFEYLFSRIQKDKDARRDEKLKFTCKCSFLEIYNEHILDLLDPSSANLQIREDTKKGVYVENLTEVEVMSARDVIQQLIQGSANRKVAATNMNHASSRSHSVFTCIIESKWESEGVTHYRFARLNLVDLAGSERQKSSGAEGERLKEATNINKSLSTLGLVIMNLVSISNGKSLHVPYRDSKLTFLLQDSLGGNAKTIIIANISPSSCCSMETLSTLKFAQRAKFIKNHAIVNEDASGDVLALRHENQILKKEVSRLRSLINGGSESCDGDVFPITFPGSPGAFKWDGLHGFSSPLVSGKKISHFQKKEYEVALVGAFRREKDKDTTLQALETEHQAALQLAKQREDEIQGLKMRLRFREAGIKRLEAVASGKISAETHLLKEKEEYLKEIEVLRAEVGRNQEATRFAMENLRLKEEIKRLKSFYEEGERERMIEQITILQNKLLEALDWKLMHEPDPANIQNDIQGDTNFLSSNQESASPWRTSMNEENEFLRMQAIQNQSELDSLCKRLDFCVEEKEQLERHVNDLEKALEVERSSKEATAEQEQKQQTEVPSLMTDDMPKVGQSDQMEIKTMVDAIAAASQREAEAHEMAIFLSKENDGLRTKLKDLIEDNNKLIDLYERAVAENNKKSSDGSLNPHADPVEDHSNHITEVAEQKELEMQREVESLKYQLIEIHEENDKLMSLYETAMQERDAFKRLIASGQSKHEEDKGDFSCPDMLVQIDGGQCLTFGETSITIDDEFGPEETESVGPYLQKGNDDLDLEVTQVYEVDVSNGCSEFSIGSQRKDDLSDAYEVDMQPLAEDMKSDVPEPIVYDIMEIDELKEPEELELEMREKLMHAIPAEMCENLNSIRKKLVEAQEKLSHTAQAFNKFGLLEKAVIEVDELSEKISRFESSIQAKRDESTHLKVLSSELHERKELAYKKLLAVKNSLQSFSSSVNYFEQREAAARSKLICKEKLNRLQIAKREMKNALGKCKETKAELESSIESLRLKLEEENRKLESDRVLFAIDNVEKISNDLKWRMSSKATELLKAEEEKTNIQNQINVKSVKLVDMKKESEAIIKNLSEIDSKIRVLGTELEKEVSSSVEQMEHKLQSAIREKEMLIEVNENGRKEFENMIVEYYKCLFEADLKEGEMKFMDEEVVVELQKLEDLKRTKDEATRRKTQLIEAMACESGFVCDKMESDLHGIEQSVVELNCLLEQCSSGVC